VKGLQKMPVMNTSYTEVDGKPGVIRHPQVNLGLAVDVTKSDGDRTLYDAEFQQLSEYVTASVRHRWWLPTGSIGRRSTGGSARLPRRVWDCEPCAPGRRRVGHAV